MQITHLFIKCFKTALGEVKETFQVQEVKYDCRRTVPKSKTTFFTQKSQTLVILKGSVFLKVAVSLLETVQFIQSCLFSCFRP